MLKLLQLTNLFDSYQSFFSPSQRSKCLLSFLQSSFDRSYLTFLKGEKNLRQSNRQLLIKKTGQRKIIFRKAKLTIGATLRFQTFLKLERRSREAEIFLNRRLSKFLRNFFGLTRTMRNATGFEFLAFLTKLLKVSSCLEARRTSPISGLAPRATSASNMEKENPAEKHFSAIN